MAKLPEYFHERGEHCDFCTPRKAFDRPAVVGLVIVVMACLLGAMLALAGCATQRDFSRAKMTQHVTNADMMGYMIKLSSQINQLADQDIKMLRMIQALERQRDEKGRYKAVGRTTNEAYPEAKNPSLCELMPGNEVCKP